MIWDYTSSHNKTHSIKFLYLIICVLLCQNLLDFSSVQTFSHLYFYYVFSIKSCIILCSSSIFLDCFSSNILGLDNSSWSLSSFICSSGLSFTKKFVKALVNIPIVPIPTSISKTASHFPKMEAGTISPYPTVVTVTRAHQRLSEKDFSSTTDKIELPTRIIKILTYKI
ncbi:Uncharacterised protein [Streptococcus pneumoniae]|nr:Uncharacterised protein [Streptococcus pneumoniae]